MRTFNGIALETENAEMAKSVALAAIDSEKYGSKNMSYTDMLSEYMETHTLTKEQMDAASKVFTLMAMNYQVCNGGVMQYYDNGYGDGKEPHNEHDCYIYDKNEITSIYNDELIPMVESVYGNNSLVANTLKNLSITWDCVDYIEPEYTSGMYYEEDEDEWEEFDPYVVNDDSFERILYNFDEYDTILEMYSEYTYKKYFVNN